jgi:hypothetical protein
MQLFLITCTAASYSHASMSYSEFATKVIERHKLREINGKLGTLCEGILNGTGIIAVSRNGKLYATIEYQEDEPIAAFMCRQKDMACVRFVNGKIVWMSLLASEELRDAFNEMRGIVR